jgi:hypothetical protein
MRSIAALTLNVIGQQLALLVPNGRPSAATFAVFRNYSVDDGVPEFSGTATVDTPNTTVSASSGPAEVDPQKLSLTSTTGIVTGRRYLLAENAVQEWVEPIELRTGYIRVRHPLKNSFTTAATLVSTWLTAAVDSTFIADRSKLSDLTDMQADYRVRWSITVGGETKIAYSFFDVVRVETRHSVTIDDINARAPGLVDSLPTEYRSEDGRPLVDAAWRALRAHFTAIGIDVHSLRDDEVIDELVILRALRVLAEGGWHPATIEWQPYLELVTGNYDRFFEQHFAVTVKHRQQLELAVTNAREVTGSRFWRK